MAEMTNICFSLLLSLLVVQGLQSVRGEQKKNTKNVLLSMGTLKSIFQPLLSSGDASKLDSYVDNIIDRFNMRTKTTTEYTPIDKNSEMDKLFTQLTLNENSIKISGPTTVHPLKKVPNRGGNIRTEVKSSKTNHKRNGNETLSSGESNNSLLNFIKQEILKKISLKPQNQFLPKNNQTEAFDNQEKIEFPEILQKDTENQYKPFETNLQENQKLTIKPNPERPSKYSLRTTPTIKKQTLKHKKQDDLNGHKKFDTDLQESNDKVNVLELYNKFTEVKKRPNDNININPSYDEETDNKEDTISHENKKDVLIKDVGNQNLSQNINGILQDFVENHKDKSTVEVILKELQEVVSKNEIKNIKELNRLFNGIVEKHTNTTELPVKVQSEQKPEDTQIKFGQNVFWNLWKNLVQPFAQNTADVQSSTAQQNLPLYLTQFPSKIPPLAHIAGATALGAFALGALVASPFPKMLRRSDDGKIAWIESLSFWNNKGQNEEPPPVPFSPQSTRNVFTSNIQYPIQYPSSHGSNVDLNESPYHNNPINYSWNVRRNNQINRNNYHRNQHSGYHFRKASSKRPTVVRDHQARFDQEKDQTSKQTRFDPPRSEDHEIDVRKRVTKPEKNSKREKNQENTTKTRYVTADEVNKIAQKSLLDLLKNYREILPSEETADIGQFDNISSGSSDIPPIVRPGDQWVPLSASQKGVAKNIPEVLSKLPARTDSSGTIAVRIGYPPGYKQTRLQYPKRNTSTVKITQNKGGSNSPGPYRTIEKDEKDILRGHLIHFRDKYMSRYGRPDDKAQT